LLRGINGRIGRDICLSASPGNGEGPPRADLTLGPFSTPTGMVLVLWGVIVVTRGLLDGGSPTSRVGTLMAFGYYVASIGGWLA